MSYLVEKSDDRLSHDKAQIFEKVGAKNILKVRRRSH